jgi:tRNA A37 threonylcarbamoyltransferase TsaD
MLLLVLVIAQTAKTAYHNEPKEPPPMIGLFPFVFLLVGGRIVLVVTFIVETNAVTLLDATYNIGTGTALDTYFRSGNLRVPVSPTNALKE